MTPKEEESWLEHARWVRALARDVLRDAQLAEDVTQEALLSAWQGGSAPTGDQARLRSWLAATARNIARMTRRSESNRRAREKEAAVHRPSSTGPIDERIEVQRRVAEALATLPAQDREIVVLRYFDGHSVVEIAKRLGATPNSISSRLSRARSRLRTGLDERAEDGRSSPSWAFVALGVGYRPALPAVAATTLSAATTPYWLFPLAMKKFIVVAAALSLLLGGLWFTATPKETNEIEQEASATGAVLPPAGVNALVAVEAPDERGKLSLTEAVAQVAEPVDLVAAPSATGSLLVKVVSDDTELPVEGVGLRLTSFTASRWFDSKEGETDANGERRFHDLLPAKRLVTAWRSRGSDDSGASAKVKVVAGETAEITLRIDGGETISGRVIDETGRSVGHAEIWLSPGNGSPMTALRTGYSDAQGRFSIPHAMGFQAVGARAPGKEPSVQMVPQLVKPRDPEIGTELVVEGLGGRLNGRVVHPSGDPVPNALVCVARNGPPSPGRPIPQENGFAYAPPILMLRTSADGSFSTSTMGSGSFTVLARGRETDLKEVEVVVAPGGAAEVELVVSAAGSLSGVVTDHLGAPVAGAHVSTSDGIWGFAYADTTTNQDGTYSFPALQTGPVKFDVEIGRSEQGVRETVMIRADQGTVWSPSLPAPLTIMGRALSSDGAPLTGFHVRGRASGEAGPMAQFQVDVAADGSFIAPNCLDAAYDLSLNLPGQWMNAPLMTAQGVRAGSVDSELFAEEASIPRCALKGVVCDDEGNPIPFSLRLECQDPLVLVPRDFSDPSGAFEIPYLPPGQYKLTFEAEGFASTIFDLKTPLAEDEVREIPLVRFVRQP